MPASQLRVWPTIFSLTGLTSDLALPNYTSEGPVGFYKVSIHPVSLQTHETSKNSPGFLLLKFCSSQKTHYLPSRSRDRPQLALTQPFSYYKTVLLRVFPLPTEMTAFKSSPEKRTDQ